MTNPVLFALTVLALLATPGPTNTLLATVGASTGFRASLPLVPAETAAYLISISLIFYLLGPVVASSPVFGLVLKLVVAAYLLHTAWRLWHGAASASAGVQLITARKVFVTTLLNPKAIVFALGIVPLEAANGWLYLVAFALLTAGVALCWIGFGAMMGKAAKTTGHNALVPRIGAAAVSTFAVVLLTSSLLR